jgi:hypothetical protein
MVWVDKLDPEIANATKKEDMVVPYEELMDDDSATEDPDKDAAMVERYYNEQHYLKYFLEREWYINYAFFHGKQWVAWNRITNKIEELPRTRRGEVRITSNFIWGRVISTHAKLTGSKIQHYIMPRKNSEDDRESARKAHKILAWLRETTNYDAKWREAIFNMILCGTCFLKIFMDTVPNEYDMEIEEDENGMPVLESNGEPHYVKGPKFRINIDVVTPFDILVDQSGTNMENIRWIMQIKQRPLSYIKAKYPRYSPYVQSDVDTRLARYFEQRIQTISDAEGTFSQSNIDIYGSEPKVTVKEYWESPSDKYPNGRVLTIANRVLLKAVENPMPEGKFPFYPFFYIKNPMRFWGSTFITHIVPIQREYNKRRSQVIESITKMGKLKWLLPRGSGVEDFAIDTEVGEIVEFNPVAGMAPQQARMQPLPPYVQADQQMLMQEMDLISGQPDITRSIQGMGKNVRTQGAAAMLQEMEQLRMFPTFQQHDDTHEDIFTAMLKLFEKYFLFDQEITVFDIETDQLDSFDASGDELKGNTRVLIQSGREFPQSKQVKQAQIMQYYQVGLLGNPGDDRTRKRVLRLLEFGDVASIFADNAEEESLIMDENQMLKSGEIPEVEDFHDHWLHLEGHDRILKSKGHKMDDDVKKAFLQHREAHGKKLDKIMQMMGGQQPPPSAQKGKGKGAPGAQGPRGKVAPQPSGIPGGNGAQY